MDHFVGATTVPVIEKLLPIRSLGVSFDTKQVFDAPFDVVFDVFFNGVQEIETPRISAI